MIREWRLENFKSVAHSQKFLFRPLTVFAGANSSGKSSVLQSILLIAQSLASKVATRQLVLNGELLKLGTFDDVVAECAEVPQINIGFTLEVEPGLASERAVFRGFGRRFFPSYYSQPPRTGGISVDLSFGPNDQDEQSNAPKIRSLQAILLKASFRASLFAQRAGSESLDSTTMTLKRRSRSEIDSTRADYSFSNDNPSPYLDARTLAYHADVSPKDAIALRRYAAQGYSGAVDTVSVTLDHFLPSWLIVGVNAATRQIYSSLDELGKANDTDKLLRAWRDTNAVTKAIAASLEAIAVRENASVDEVINTLVARRRMPRSGSAKAMNIDILKEVMSRLGKEDRLAKDIEGTDLPDSISFLSSNVSESFGTMRYLGPLRDDPKPVYAIASSLDPSDVGVKGEYTAAVLDLYADQVIDYAPPPSDSVREYSRGTLKTAVLEWLRYFEIAEDYLTKEEGKLGHSLVIRPSGVTKDLDLTNVGVGVSQVLPIVVMSLIADPGSVLVFEQPELHLHPKVQSFLGDFFLALIRMRRQCIIETHSEYLINRLRLRCAESGWNNPLNEKIMLYFVERNGPQSGFASIEINEYGAIADWPRGFFDQGPSEADRIIAAASKKRQSKIRH